MNTDKEASVSLIARLKPAAVRLVTGRLKWPLIAVLAVTTILAFDVLRYFVYPDVSSLADNNPSVTRMMEIRQREWKASGRDVRIRQEWVPLSRISPSMINAVLIGEDDKFWSHEGFDLEGMEKAFEKNIRKRKLSAGGSTITQQLAKNLYLSPSRNPVRKLKEAIIAWRMERTLKKKRILELYLNVAEWGEGIFGVEAAARHYYGVPASDIGPMQAARLASVLPNPRKYRPTDASRYVKNRSGIIYRVMSRRGYSEAEDLEPAPESAPGYLPVEDTDAALGNMTGAVNPQIPELAAEEVPADPPAGEAGPEPE